MAEPELLSNQDYSALLPLLTPSEVANLDLVAESNKTFSRVWVLRDEARQIASFVLVWWLDEQVEVVHVATRLAARRQGLARRLLQHISSAMRAASVPNLWLEVRRSNEPAVNLYRSLGFAVSRERKAYYSDGEDALEMCLQVRAA